MTNTQIIFDTSIDLMNEGIIGTTGRKITIVDVNGEEKTIPEPEPIHTFATWKALGRRVKRGERAKGKARIWKFTSKNVEGEDEPETNMFMKDAYFFTYSQTEAI